MSLREGTSRLDALTVDLLLIDRVRYLNPK
jgi:hypothetical protein